MRFPNESSRLRKIRRFSALLLCLLLPLSGCRRTEGAGGQTPSPEGGDVSSAAEAGVLTHVFRPESFAIPENYSFNGQILPRYDEEAGTLTYLAACWKSWEDENGMWQSETVNEIVTEM